MNLESRVTGLERTVRRQRFAGIVVLLVLGGALLLGQNTQPKYVGMAVSIGGDAEGVTERVIYRMSATGKIEKAKLSSFHKVMTSWSPVSGP